MKKYRFYLQNKNSNSTLSFIIEAADPDDALQKAYEDWGDVVKIMTYKEVDLKK